MIRGCYAKISRANVGDGMFSNDLFVISLIPVNVWWLMRLMNWEFKLNFLRNIFKRLFQLCLCSRAPKNLNRKRQKKNWLKPRNHQNNGKKRNCTQKKLQNLKGIESITKKSYATTKLKNSNVKREHEKNLGAVENWNGALK